MSGVWVLNTYFTTPYLDDHLAPVRVILDDGKGAVPPAPIVLGGRRSMVVYKISFTVVVLASDRSLSA